MIFSDVFGVFENVLNIKTMFMAMTTWMDVKYECVLFIVLCLYMRQMPI